MKQTKKEIDGKMTREETIAWLEHIVHDCADECRDVCEWIDTGKWMKDVKGFLRQWEGDDYEEERNGRTDAKMACDLVEEIKRIRLHAIASIAFANWCLMTGNFPNRLMSRGGGWFFFENVVARIQKQMVQHLEEGNAPACRRLNCNKEKESE